MEAKEETLRFQWTPLQDGIRIACMSIQKCLYNAIQIVLFVEKSADRYKGFNREFIQALSSSFDKLLRNEVHQNEVLEKYRFNFSISTYGSLTDCTFHVRGCIGETVITSGDFTVYWTDDILGAQETGLIP